MKLVQAVADQVFLSYLTDNFYKAEYVKVKWTTARNRYDLVDAKAKNIWLRYISVIMSKECFSQKIELILLAK